MLKRLTIACLAMAVLVGSAAAKPPMEAFGDAAGVRAMDLSPDGTKLAFLARQDDADILVIRDLKTGESRALGKVTDIRARYVHFAGNNNVILIASEHREAYYRFTGGRFEYSAAFAFDLKTGKHIQLLRNTENLFPAQSGLGIVVGIDPSKRNLFMPAYIGTRAPQNDLLRVPLDDGRGHRSGGGAAGTSDTIDWVLNANGQVIAREEFNSEKQLHTIQAKQEDGAWKTIYSKEGALRDILLSGTSADGKSLVVVDNIDSEFMSLSAMSLSDGTITGPLLTRDDAEVVDVIQDLNRTAYGVRYSGMFPTYDMFDEAVEEDIKIVQETLEGSAVYLNSWSDDWSRMLFFVEGGKSAERYFLFDRNTQRLSVAASARPSIKEGDVGEVITIEYKARDGLTIPALITWPAGVPEAARKNLPLVVMPHGGPQSYDAVGFDWLAQFVANEGYAVLQPNFRGSAGLGAGFVKAGYGEWGRKMQDDITDGVDALVKIGWANPERICIVGWSYGGYAALAGGALTPGKYKCVASIAGVSNLRDMLLDAKNRYGRTSPSVAYWEMLIGDPDKDRDAIDAVSPSRLADNFKAPVLLVHGSADTTVPAYQSDIMNDALRGAKKNVRYIRIPGDDHSLVDNGSRRQVLTALGEFLKENIGN